MTDESTQANEHEVDSWRPRDGEPVEHESPNDALLSDFEARSQIRSALDENLIVEAGAGTGKTTELIERVSSLIASGRATADQVLVLSFTRRAAGEIKVRLREKLELLGMGEMKPEEHARITRAIIDLDQASIGTIHSFCTDVLREFSIEAGVDPLFSTLEEAQGDALMSRVFRGFLDELLSDAPRAIERVLRGAYSGDADKQLFSAVKKLNEWRHLDAPWDVPKGDYEAGMVELAQDMARLGQHARFATDGDAFGDCLAAFYAEAAELKHHLIVGGLWKGEVQEDGEFDDNTRRHGLDRAEGLLRNLARNMQKRRIWTTRGKREQAFGNVTVDQLRAERSALADKLALWLKRADAHLAADLRTVLSPCVVRYSEAKRQRGVLDFDDLIEKTARLLEENPSVRKTLRNRFVLIALDEVQDTDPRQLEIALLLAMDGDRLLPGRLFIVGDPKQSIYAFRRANIAFYQKFTRRLEALGAKRLCLTSAFRFQRKLVDFYNATFEPAFKAEEGVQVGYAPLTCEREMPSSSDDQPCVVVLPVAKPWHWNGSGFHPGESEAVGAGHFLRWLVEESGWVVSGEDGARPVRYGDVCLLFPTRTAVAHFTKQLEAHAIPYAGIGSYGRAEWDMMATVLRAIEWPDDRLAMYAALRGPLFAHTDSELLAYEQAGGALAAMAPPLEALPAVSKNTSAENSKVNVDAFDELEASRKTIATLHVLRNSRPASETLSELFLLSRVMTAARLRPGGVAFVAQLEAVLNLARTFDEDSSDGFRAFVETVEAQELTPETHAEDAVRLMTVHGAKGLEFPVVMLCDLKGSTRQPSDFFDLEKKLWAGTLCGAQSRPFLEHQKLAKARARAEDLRKVYVAATRARDLLVVPGIGDFSPEHHKLDWWSEPLMRATTPVHEERKNIRAPRFDARLVGQTTVLKRPGRMAKLERTEVKSGIQKNGVLWWRPLGLFGPWPKGLTRTDVLNREGKEAKAGAERYAEFLKTRKERALMATQPTLRRRTVTAASMIEAPQRLSVSVATTSEANTPRPRGPRFGTLVHQVLGHLKLKRTSDSADSPPELDSLVSYFSRLLGATDDEVRAATRSVRAALAHPVLVRAAAATTCHQEFPLVMKEADGTITEGVADLVFLEDGLFGDASWVVVDYKTDLAEDTRDSYLVQLERYMLAVSEQTSCEVQGILLGV